MTDKKRNVSLTSEDIRHLQSLVPGMQVDLQITTPTAPKRVKTDYVGMLASQCMIFSIPATPKWVAVRELLVSGNPVVVRFVVEDEAGVVVAFRVKVVRLQSKPFSLLYTTFPTAIQSLGLRAEKRSQPGITVTVTAAEFAEAKDVTGIIVDMSSRGCRIALPLDPQWPILEIDAQVTLVYQSAKESASIQGAIKNKRHEQDFIYYGIQFEDGQTSVSTLLQRHILIG